MISVKLIKLPKIYTVYQRCRLLKFSSSAKPQQSPTTPYKPKQTIDSEEVIDQKVNLLTQFILSSKHPIFFTGAGISTSLGIPDYRSGEGTIIQTGPGLWNRPKEQVKVIQQKRNTFIDELIPSITHMAIYTLIEKNVFKHVVSQNTDGLHLRSGINKRNLSELHGNRNLEYCTRCERKYLRDFRTIKKTDKDLKPGEKRCHITERKCQNCSGDLHDSIVYFGEKLPKDELVKSYEEGAKSDLCIAIGSSLTVKPSANVPLLPLKYNESGKLAIINIQQTPLNQYATLKINGFCDTVMTKLMEKLRIPIAEYRVERYLQITAEKQYNGWSIKVNGVDAEHYNFSYIRNVQVISANSKQHKVEEQEKTTISELRNMFDFRLSADEHESLGEVNVKVKFFGPFPDLKLNLEHVFGSKDIIGHESKIIRLISTNNGSWTVHKTN